MKHEQQELARDLYLNTDKTQQEIADILDVNRRTVYLWIRNGRWEEMKIAARQAPGIILQDIYTHITAVNDKIRRRDEDDRCPTMQEVEMLRKLIGMTTSIQKRNVGAYMEAYQELIYFISRRDVTLARDIIRHTDSYVKGTMGDKIFHASLERDENVRDVIANLKKEEAIAAGEPGPAGIKSDPAENQQVQQPSGTAPITRAYPAKFCDNNGIFLLTPNPVPGLPETQSAPALPETNIAPEVPKYPTADDVENEIFLITGNIHWYNTFDKIMDLPPVHRPSPFRDCDIVWVNHIDDVEKRFDNYGRAWGEFKMGDSVRHYPDIDPAVKRSQEWERMMKEMRDPLLPGQDKAAA